MHPRSPWNLIEGKVGKEENLQTVPGHNENNKGAKGTDGRGQCIVLGCVDVVYGFDIVKVLKLQKKGAHYI